MAFFFRKSQWLLVPKYLGLLLNAFISPCFIPVLSLENRVINGIRFAVMVRPQGQHCFRLPVPQRGIAIRFPLHPHGIKI